ncbi:cell division protein SepF [Saccharothrix obliqua]|uniref:cell division protein SepF n=1 Tax=Saccharothrix obliqua TaxID=2861747 RepID=UPI001C5DD1B5|nr:cell division protein SepF [Saccharothrix obliqua]MBW4721471.1 cell division protein SepF [Saccharothrix obliqua]
MTPLDLALRFVEALVWPLSVLVAVIIVVRVTAPRAARPAPPPPRPVAQHAGDSVGTAIAEVEALTGRGGGPPPDATVHLGETVRLTPTDHRDAEWHVVEHLRAGHVVIIDLSALDETAATRLVEFCGGFTLGGGGTFFQISGTVVLLTPERSR